MKNSSNKIMFTLQKSYNDFLHSLSKLDPGIVQLTTKGLKDRNSFKISYFETRIMAKLRRFISGIRSKSFILIKFVETFISSFRHFVQNQGISKSLPLSKEEYQDFSFENLEN